MPHVPIAQLRGTERQEDYLCNHALLYELRRECGTYVQGKTIMARKVPTYQMIYRIPVQKHTNDLESNRHNRNTWENVALLLLAFRARARARTHTHTHTHTRTEAHTVWTINHTQPSSASHPTLLSCAPRLTSQSLHLPQCGAEVACRGD